MATLRIILVISHIFHAQRSCGVHWFRSCKRMD